jgi:hypothetical protein
MNDLRKIRIRLPLDCGIGEVGRRRAYLVIGFSFSPFSMAELAILLIETLALLQIVKFSQRPFITYLTRCDRRRRKVRQSKQQC